MIIIRCDDKILQPFDVPLFHIIGIICLNQCQRTKQLAINNSPSRLGAFIYPAMKNPIGVLNIIPANLFSSQHITEWARQIRLQNLGDQYYEEDRKYIFCLLINFALTKQWCCDYNWFWHEKTEPQCNGRAIVLISWSSYSDRYVVNRKDFFQFSINNHAMSYF